MSLFRDIGKMAGQTGRKANWIVQSITGGDSQSHEAEYAVGRDLAQAFAKENELDSDPEVQKYLNAVATRLVQCVTDHKRVFTFRAVNKEEYNAFAYPGGFIFVTLPLLELCEWNADEVAFVLGHEMGHVLGRHVIDRMMANSMIRGGLSRFPIGGLLGMGILHAATSLLNSGYSQDQELEADSMAMKFVHYAGFKVDAGKDLLIRLNNIPSQGLQQSSYFSSHPPVNVRVDRIERYVREHAHPAK